MSVSFWLKSKWNWHHCWIYCILTIYSSFAFNFLKLNIVYFAGLWNKSVLVLWASQAVCAVRQVNFYSFLLAGSLEWLCIRVQFLRASTVFGSITFNFGGSGRIWQVWRTAHGGEGIRWRSERTKMWPNATFGQMILGSFCVEGVSWRKTEQEQKVN